MQQVKQVRMSKQRQVRIPVEFQEHGFNYSDYPVFNCFINDKGNLEMEVPKADPIEKLQGILKGAKINPVFKGLDTEEQIELAKKMHYEEKYKNNRR